MSQTPSQPFWFYEFTLVISDDVEGLMGTKA